MFIFWLVVVMLRMHANWLKTSNPQDWPTNGLVCQNEWPAEYVWLTTHELSLSLCTREASEWSPMNESIKAKLALSNGVQRELVSLSKVFQSILSPMDMLIIVTVRSNVSLCTLCLNQCFRQSFHFLFLYRSIDHMTAICALLHHLHTNTTSVHKCLFI